jgi:membrane protein YdbS with pleckstrin-like domain
METCANCGRTIGNLEQHAVWQNNVVCFECNDRLTRQAELSKQGGEQKAVSKTDDAVVFSGHPCMFRARPLEFILCILLIPVFGVGLICFLIWWLRCRASTLTITRQRLIYITGILSKNTNEIWHADVRDIIVRQSFLQRLFGCGQIQISTAGQSGVEISAQGFRDPQKLADYIREFRTARP